MCTIMKYIIGTRGSKLALIQTEYVKQRLEEQYPEHEFEVKIIKTKGDLIQDRPLHQIGAKGLFVKEIEEQILDGEVHIGVHSMKDMPAVPAKGLVFTKCWKREDPRDVLILREKNHLSELPYGAVIGTGSKRRKYQLLKLRPDLQVVDIRGNVDTRIRKMQEQHMDGIVLAAAGLHRLNRKDVISQYLSSEEMISAPAQGILALEVREDAYELQEMLDTLYDKNTHQEALAEREFLKLIGGDCHVPIGAICTEKEKGYQLRCIFGNESGEKLAYAVVEGREPLELAKKAVKEIQKQMAGTVYLVGGGPGDPRLITVKGLEAIRQADCIIYDRLASPKLLEEAKIGCEKIYAGKENHHHTLKQEEINVLLAEKAMQYEKVVRLKGGDVYVFGRGGEEGMYLKEQGISFEVVPGVSSAIGGLAYAGIPITHRGTAGGFHVVTAHNKKDELADIDFEAMAKGKDTCVFLMGLSKVSEIVHRLLGAGMPAKIPAAVIASATTNGQKTVTGNLEDIAEKVQEARLESPALIVVGEVIKLRHYLNFFEEKPLFGKRYLVPKIGEETSGLTEKLETCGAFAEEIQVGKIEHIAIRFTRQELEKADWLIFTSRHGVEAFFENLFASGLDVRALGQAKIAVIGPQTGRLLKRYGLTADLVPEEYHSDALKILLKNVVKTSDTIWYPKAANGDSSLKESLEENCDFVELPIYENKVVETKIPEDLQLYDGILFTCASSAERFFQQTDCAGVVYSIGPKTSKVLKKLGIEKIIQAEKATYDGLVDAVVNTSFYGKWLV